MPTGALSVQVPAFTYLPIHARDENAAAAATTALSSPTKAGAAAAATMRSPLRESSNQTAAAAGAIDAGECAADAGSLPVALPPPVAEERPPTVCARHWRECRTAGVTAVTQCQCCASPGTAECVDFSQQQTGDLLDASDAAADVRAAEFALDALLLCDADVRLHLAAMRASARLGWLR